MPTLAEKKQAIADLMGRSRILLSPMAGVTDMVFRDICRRHGADVTYCEFVSADGVLHGNEATVDLMLLADGEPDVGIQLFGSDPDRMARAAETAQRLQPTLIDLNFGCPVKKVVKKNGGSALLCDMPLMERIVRAVVAATDLPVTAKIRIGWSEGTRNHTEVVPMLEEAGACAVTVHGRTRDQLFRGHADWDAIAQCVEVATGPLIGNGDVWSGADFLRMKEHTGCDAVMVARAAIGNPWIFEEVHAAIEGREWRAPTVGRVVDTLLEHLDRELDLKGPRVGMNRMKKHFGAYLKGFPGVSELRKEVFGLNDRATIEAAFRRYRDQAAGVRAA